MMRGTVRQVRNADPGQKLGGRESTGYGRAFFYSSRDICAIWHGGEYVDLYEPGTTSRDALLGDAIPFDCFNVWDHAADAPTIDRTAGAFRAYMDDRMRTARVVRSGFPGEVWIEEPDA